MKYTQMVLMGALLSLVLAMGLVACGGGGSSSDGGDGANSAPVAKAGPDQRVSTGSTVTLDGSDSSDADGDTLTYSWSFTSRPGASTAALSDPTAVKPTFTADVDGDYVLSLVVNDGAVDSAADTVTITAATANSAPVAKAGPDQSVSTGSTVTLDGSDSSDADGDTLTYSWSFTSRPGASTAALSDPTAVKPTFTADVDGDYVLSLVVNDGAVDSAADTVTITANSPLPDTGQTGDYTATFGEDSDYTINPPSYTDNGNGTVTDNVTGLIWQKEDDDTTRTRNGAGSYCTGLSLVDYTDWRLPTKKELLGIVDYGISSPAINTIAFPGTNASNYWSSSPYAGGSSHAWAVHFDNGRAYLSYTTYKYYVRCVR